MFNSQTEKLLQGILEELRKNTEFREQTAKALLERAPRFSSEEHERRMAEIREVGEKRRQEDEAYRARLIETMNRLIEVIAEVSTKLTK